MRTRNAAGYIAVIFGFYEQNFPWPFKLLNNFHKLETVRVLFC